MAKNFRMEVRTNRTGKVSGAVRRELSKVVRKAGADVKAHAQVNAPKDTGYMAGSIENRSTGPLTQEVSVGAEYGAAVEFGTGVYSTDPESDHMPIVIEPVDKKALSWPGAEHPVAKVVQQGQKAQPFLGPAVDEVRAGFEAAVAEAVRRGAESVT